jgi:hypothetical protein
MVGESRKPLSNLVRIRSQPIAYFGLAVVVKRIMRPWRGTELKNQPPLTALNSRSLAMYKVSVAGFERRQAQYLNRARKIEGAMCIVQTLVGDNSRDGEDRKQAH